LEVWRDHPVPNLVTIVARRSGWRIGPSDLHRGTTWRPDPSSGHAELELGAISSHDRVGVLCSDRSYDRQRIINIGTNRWAVEPDTGLTWMDEENGRQASAFAGYTINSENTATHYHSGQEFHADFVVAQHLPKGFVVGMAGYALQQTTADSGRGAIFGRYRGRVLALGPLVGKTVDLWKLSVTFAVKYDFEFAAQNRSTGDDCG
jgi:hypothetical protein